MPCLLIGKRNFGIVWKSANVSHTLHRFGSSLLTTIFPVNDPLRLLLLDHYSHREMNTSWLVTASSDKAVLRKLSGLINSPIKDYVHKILLMSAPFSGGRAWFSARPQGALLTQTNKWQSWYRNMFASVRKTLSVVSDISPFSWSQGRTVTLLLWKLLTSVQQFSHFRSGSHHSSGSLSLLFLVISILVTWPGKILLRNSSTTFNIVMPLLPSHSVLIPLVTYCAISGQHSALRSFVNLLKISYYNHYCPVLSTGNYIIEVTHLVASQVCTMIIWSTRCQSRREFVSQRSFGGAFNFWCLDPKKAGAYSQTFLFKSIVIVPSH